MGKVRNGNCPMGDWGRLGMIDIRNDDDVITNEYLALIGIYLEVVW